MGMGLVMMVGGGMGMDMVVSVHQLIGDALVLESAQ